MSPAALYSNVIKAIQVDYLNRIDSGQPLDGSKERFAITFCCHLVNGWTPCSSCALFGVNTCKKELWRCASFLLFERSSFKVLSQVGLHMNDVYILLFFREVSTENKMLYIVLSCHNPFSLSKTRDDRLDVCFSFGLWWINKARIPTLMSTDLTFFKKYCFTTVKWK